MQKKLYILFILSKVNNVTTCCMLHFCAGPHPLNLLAIQGAAKKGEKRQYCIREV